MRHLTLLIVPPLAMAAAFLPARRVILDAEVESGVLSFTGHATVGDFVGTTNRVGGAIVGAPDYARLHGFVEASVASLTTGNAHRDRDLRSSMEVERYPTMRFDLASASLDDRGGSPDSTSLILHGAFSIHGITRHVDLPCKLARVADTTRVTAEFPLDLADYRVGGLTKMMGLLRMDRHIDVRVDVRFVDHPFAGNTP